MKILLPLLAALAIQAAPLPSFVTIKNVNVVDVESGTVQKGMNVVIRGTAIVSVGPKLGPNVIDGTGKYLIPGLWDMHVHLWEKRPMLGMYVANGVLGVRDMGSSLSTTKAWRTEVETGAVIGPRIYTAGSPVDGPGGGNAKMPVQQVLSAEEARRAVDALNNQGTDFVKVLSTLSRDAYVSLAQRARVTRTPFAGHLPEAVTVTQAIDARQKSLEHLFGIALACSSEEPTLREARSLAIDNHDNAELARIRERTYETFSKARATELFGRMARFDVWQTPTLTLRRRLALMGLEELVGDPHAKQIPAEVLATWEDPRNDLKKASPEQMERFRRDYEFHRELVLLMQRSGVGLLAGTDTGDPYVLPGYALHDELRLLVEAGLSPAQALRTATINPARYFGAEGLSGSIARGRRADLLMVDANPLDDIRNANRISAVIVRGRLLNRKQLDQLAKAADLRWDASVTAPRALSPRKPGPRSH